MGKCKLCGLEKKLVKSHIIPKRFFMQIRKIDSKGFFITPTDINKPLKRSQHGIYERIICSDCEELFNSWDDYAVELLLDKVFEIDLVKYDNTIVYYALCDINYLKLRMFFLSTLWRMSVSQHDYFGEIDLGTDESVIAQMIIDNDPGYPCFYPTIITSFTDPYRAFNIKPCRDESGDGVYFVLYFGGYKILIRTKNDMPTWMEGYILEPDTKLIIVYQDLVSSKEFKSFMETSKTRFSK